ncbi:hypothetical protein ACFQAV_11555 [Companilactobacillus huachuanensis]|uniref:Surface layer protein A domain-containing protein n=1 Tax=Companilactobacillus huachuanensis TaxID=2559914 RepID=A0ABW1RPX4_9LACO|nr:hypothetical protein [Companilactobacillus huachuanensis]
MMSLGLLGALSPVLVAGLDAQTVNAESLDYNFDPDEVGPVAIPMYVNVDGQEKDVETLDYVWISKVGGMKTIKAPLVDKHVANPSTITVLRTTTGLRVLQAPTYTPSDPKLAPKTATIEERKLDITVRNDNGDFCPLVAFSTKTGEIYNLSDRALGNNTDWYSDKVKTYDGAQYYRVATNEWVKDIYFHGGSSI